MRQFVKHKAGDPKPHFVRDALRGLGCLVMLSSPALGFNDFMDALKITTDERLFLGAFCVKITRFSQHV